MPKRGYVVWIDTTRIVIDLTSQDGLKPGSVKFTYTGGDRGWKGDVPIIRLATERIRGIGWKRSGIEACVR